MDYFGLNLKIFKNFAIVISIKIWSAWPFLFSKNMRSSSAFGDENGHAYQIYTDNDSSFWKFWDLDQNNSSPKFASFSENISVYEQDDWPKIDLKFFQNSKVL